MIYTIVPMPNSAIPKVMTKRSNWVSISKQDIRPKNGITGNFLMFRGTLKGLFRFGFLYRRYISDKLTRANVIKTPRLVMFATSSMSPINMKNMENTITASMAV